MKEYEKEIRDLRQTIDQLKSQIDDYKQGKAPPGEKQEKQEKQEVDQSTKIEKGW